MSEAVRLYQYKGLLSGRRVVSAEDLMATLEVSRATLKRDLAKLRDQFHVPIEFDRERGGYLLKEGLGHTDTELPGLWFSPEELLALATIQRLLEQLAPGMLGTKLRPIQQRLDDLMAKQRLSGQDVAKRIRLTSSAGKRGLDPRVFEAVVPTTPPVARSRNSVRRVMSRGRYEIRRRLAAADARSAAGLDLEVYDHYTGDVRGVNTLSGGESFLASLALALGLSDVVQSYSGGIRLDAIFVDEGFGTLDPETLDFAIRTLRDLQQAGRMVGIISHVAELKDWIDARLELKPSQDGSEVTLVV